MHEMKVFDPCKSCTSEKEVLEQEIKFMEEDLDSAFRLRSFCTENILSEEKK
ncbi:MAG: hypothetical protein ACI9S8_001780 [Chlamydiales bacterium]|jgi:hypothetical protein